MIIIALITITILFIALLVVLRRKKKYNLEIDKANKELVLKNEALNQEKENLSNEIKQQEKEKSILDASIQNANKELKNIIQNIDELKTTKDNLIQLSSDSFDSYIDNLLLAYEQADKKYEEDIAIEQNKLDQIRATRAAAQQALLQEQKVKDNADNYRLVPSKIDLSDIAKLERVKLELNKPRILSMLIWQTYWQPLAKKVFPVILENKTKCGIYKITNLITNECYIGQSVDINKRWSEHCKCGLGIDTPPGNKLYKAMQEYGLENFTFELLAECSKEELNEKETYFINLYQAKEFGYNSTGGNK